MFSLLCAQHSGYLEQISRLPELRHEISGEARVLRFYELRALRRHHLQSTVFKVSAFISKNDFQKSGVPFWALPLCLGLCRGLLFLAACKGPVIAAGHRTHEGVSFWLPAKSASTGREPLHHLFADRFGMFT